MSRNIREVIPSGFIPPEVTAERLGGEVFEKSDGEVVVKLPPGEDARLSIDDIGLKMNVSGYSTGRVSRNTVQ